MLNNSDNRLQNVTNAKQLGEVMNQIEVVICDALLLKSYHYLL